MGKYKMISLDEPKEWQGILDCCGMQDVYHGSAYHQLAEEGDAYLFSYQDEFGSAAFPVLVRNIEGTGYRDLTSAYGYPGIVSSVAANDEGADQFRCSFQAALQEMSREWKIVTAFSRTNPFIATEWLVEGSAEIVELGHTVAINLKKSKAERWADMSKGHRYDIRKACNRGVNVVEDTEFKYLDDFIKIYNETMMKNGARDSYYFPKQYYMTLKAKMGNACRLFIAKYNGVVISAAFFLVANRIINYHLSGSSVVGRELCGAKLIIDEAADFGVQQGADFLHLGGGVGAQEDPLYGFKKGFSSERHPFSVIKMICNPSVYRDLIADGNKIDDGYFPLYRRPS